MHTRRQPEISYGAHREGTSIDRKVNALRAPRLTSTEPVGLLRHAYSYKMKKLNHKSAKLLLRPAHV